MTILPKTLFFIFFLCLTSLVSAQPTLTTEGQTPNIGETYRVFYSELPNGLDVGPSGANQVWDFSNNGWNTFEIQFSIIDPETAICSEDFPSAEFVWLLDEFEAYNFYQTSDTGIDLIGGASGTEGDILFKEVHSNTEDGLHFPATYGDNYTYDTEYTSYFFGTSISGSGNGEATFDGYGTIITPEGTYDNVLRMKIEYTSSGPVGIMETQYAWILPGQFIPVMVYTIEDDPETLPSVYYAVSNDISSTSALPTIDLGLQLLQNPVRDRLQVVGNSLIEEEVNYYIIDAIGRLEVIQNIDTGIDLSNYASGNYYLIAKTARGKQVLPFVKA